MKRDDFASSPSGTLVATERDQLAFVPHPLPPIDLDYSQLSRPLSEAAEAIGELNGIGRTIANPYLLITPLQQREAISSSDMEGTYTSVDALLLAEAGADDELTPPDTREVRNYRRALSKAIDSLDDYPLSLRTLKNAHGILLSDVRRDRGAMVRAGEFKQHQNFIGSQKAIETARFISPPPREALDCLYDLEKYIHREDDGLDVLIDSALIHYQFETIHPFVDGNGRLGRMLIILHLFMRKKLAQPLLYMSPTFEARKDEYIDRMYAVSQKGDWTGWIVFYLNAMRDAARETSLLIEQLLDLQNRYRLTLQQKYRSATVLTILNYIFEHPVVSIPIMRDVLHVTYPTAQKNIDILVAENILSEVEGTSNPRFFIARDIIKIISGT